VTRNTNTPNNEHPLGWGCVRSVAEALARTKGKSGVKLCHIKRLHRSRTGEQRRTLWHLFGQAEHFAFVRCPVRKQGLSSAYVCGPRPSTARLARLEPLHPSPATRSRMLLEWSEACH
jgi:hypothetical protein